MKTVIEMAREAGLLTIGTADGSEAVYTWPKGITEELKRFADLVRADAIASERESCAKVCDRVVEGKDPDDIHSDSQWAALTLAAEIRARGQA